MNQILTNEEIMKQLYPYPEYAAAVGTLDQKVEEIREEQNSNKKILTDIVDHYSTEITKKREEIETIHEKIKQGIEFSPTPEYVFSFKDGKIHMAAQTYGKVEFTHNDRKDNDYVGIREKRICDLHGLIQVAKNALVEITEPRELIEDIAKYSEIIEIYRGNLQDPNRAALYFAFPNDVLYSLDFNTPEVSWNINSEKNITLSKLLEAKEANKRFSTVIPSEGDPTYLVINPSKSLGLNSEALDTFTMEIRNIIEHEYSQYSTLNLILGRPFLKSIDERIYPIR